MIDQSTPARRERSVRLLAVSWERLERAVALAERREVRTRVREVLDALIEQDPPVNADGSASLISEHRTGPSADGSRRARRLRLLDSSWATVDQITAAANRRGFATRTRETLDALIERGAPTTQAKAAGLVSAHRLRRYGDDSSPPVRSH